MDLRERVLAAVDHGTPTEVKVRMLGVSQPTIRRYLRLRRETGSVAQPWGQNGVEIEKAAYIKVRAVP